MDIPNKKKHSLSSHYWRETFFLPPLKMILSVFDKESRQKELENQNAEPQKISDEKKVEKLIEKLSEKEE